MKKIIVAMFVLHALCATAWAADLNLKWDKSYVYCTAGGRPDVGNGTQVSNYLKKIRKKLFRISYYPLRIFEQSRGRQICPFIGR